jgi:hypothetical protein
MRILHFDPDQNPGKLRLFVLKFLNWLILKLNSMVTDPDPSLIKQI